MKAEGTPACPACAKRAQEESKNLSNCEARCESLSVKTQRLTLALTVAGTLMGKELFDQVVEIISGVDAVVDSVSAADDIGSPGIVTTGFDFPLTGFPKQDKSEFAARPSALIEYPMPVDYSGSYLPGFGIQEQGKEIFDLITEDENVPRLIPGPSGLILYAIAGTKSRQRL